jgi:iron-sulfur cluster repair protein YtfE (RIC family)
VRPDELPVPAPPLALSWTVNDVLSRHPSTAAVFNAVGVDTCCGGAQSVGDACRDAGADAAIVLDALRATAGAAS